MDKEKEKEKEKEKLKGKKSFNIKDIPPKKLVVVLMAGILLVLILPDMLVKNNSTKDNKTNSVDKIQSDDSKNIDVIETDEYATYLETRLKEVLSKVEGIGNAEVMITLKASKELVTLKDNPLRQESMNEVDDTGGSRQSSSIEKQESTIIVDSGNGESVPYVIKEIEPEVLGVVVIAQGGNNVTIKTEIMEAVQVLFDVPAHRIKIMKMN